MSRWLLRRGARPARHVWGLGAREIAWRSGAGEVQAAEVQPGNIPAAALAGVEPGDHVDVVSANDCTVHWLQGATPTARSLAELRLAAAARCTQLFGGAAADWHVAGDWDAARAFICAAVARPLFDSVRGALEGRRCTMRWHSAWGLACARDRQRLPADGWMALRSPQRIALWHCTTGRVDSFIMLPTTRLEPDSQAGDRVAEHIRIEAARTPQLAIGTVTWLAGSPAEDARSEATAALELAA